MDTELVKKISDAEWEIMRVVWTKKEVTSGEMVEYLAAKMNWKAPTIKTLLGRLVKKGLIATKKEGIRYLYYPLVSQNETVRSATAELFSRICAKKIGRTIAELISEATLTSADVAQIQEVLKNKTTVAKIACNCIPGQCECSEHQEQD